MGGCFPETDSSPKAPAERLDVPTLVLSACAVLAEHARNTAKDDKKSVVFCYVFGVYR